MIQKKVKSEVLSANTEEPTGPVLWLQRPSKPAIFLQLLSPLIRVDITWIPKHRPQL